MIAELIETEKDYVRDLGLIVHVRRRSMFTFPVPPLFSYCTVLNSIAQSYFQDCRTKNAKD